MTKINLIEKRKKYIAQRMNKLKEMEASLNIQERKRRTRRLIELGDLAAKANIDNWHTNTLYGAFLFLKEKEHESEKNSKFIEEWTRKGGTAFAAEKEKIPSSSK